MKSTTADQSCSGEVRHRQPILHDVGVHAVGRDFDGVECRCRARSLVVPQARKWAIEFRRFRLIILSREFHRAVGRGELVSLGGLRLEGERLGPLLPLGRNMIQAGDRLNDQEHNHKSDDG